MNSPTRKRDQVVAALFGLIMAVVLTKFGNPIIFKNLETSPTNLAEWLLGVWPTSWFVYAFILTGILFWTDSRNARQFKVLPSPVNALLFAWVVWISISYLATEPPAPMSAAYPHLGVTALMLVIGGTLIGATETSKIFFRILLFGFVFALWVGLDQHYGGLEATRKAFYESPGWANAPEEMKLKIASNRIFGPFVYPNAFAGAILLWAPVLTLVLWDWTKRLPSTVQMVVVGLFVYMAAACFFWSGSKAGWLIAIGVFVVGLLHANLNRATKIGIVAAVVVLGLAGFGIKFRGYFEKGATSASARVIYWKAAVQIANAHPIVGAGPGTFARTFAPIKPAGAEMARLVHNDYLEQACDSGWPAFVFFTAFVVSALAKAHRAVTKSPLGFAAWLGALAWALQSVVEFGLYIPAISWSAFVLLGWLLLQSREVTDPLQKEKAG